MNERRGIPPESLGPGDLPTHGTAGAYILHEGRLLLEKRPQTATSYPGYWDTPGGHIEDGESPEQTLLREYREELGVALRSFFLAAVRDHRDPASGRFYRHWFFVASEWEGEIQACEGQELQWFTLAEARSLSGLNPLVSEVLEDLLQRGWL